MPHPRIYPDHVLTTAESNERRRKKCDREGICYACSKVNDRVPSRYCTSCNTHNLELGRLYRLALKRETFEAYGGCRCVCCSESDIAFLTLDHYTVVVADFEHRAGDKLWLELRRKKYPSGFRVLCFNCNIASYNNGGTCPHANSQSNEGLRRVPYAASLPR